MPKLKLTEPAIAKLRAPDPSGKQVIHWDDGKAAVPGFGVLVSGVSAKKSFVVQKDLKDGRTRRLTIGAVGELSLDAARAEAWDAIHAMRKGDDPKAKKRGGVTLREALDAYLAARKGLAAASVAGYKLAVDRYLAAWLDLPMSAITPQMVEDRHRAIASEIVTAKRAKADETRKRLGADAPPQGASQFFKGESTANSTMRSLRVLFNFAAERDPTLADNPVRRLKRQWFAEARRETYVKTSELAAFYKAVCALPNKVQRDYLLLILFTGLRRNEAASLQWSDIDFEARVIRLPAARTKAKRKLNLPMSDFVCDLLNARAKGRVVEIEFVFPADSASGHIVEPRFALDQIATTCGIKVGVHDLRRTFITIAESSDISPLALKALVNHALGGDVTAGYVMMTAERLREPAQRVADRMKQLCGIAVDIPALVEA